jgi:serine/threonine-protein phosphatase 2A regulatory subunit A
VSGCGLFTAPYSKVSAATQDELRKTFSSLVHDETPMVRRQAATNMAKFVKEMTADVAVDDMMPLFQHLAQDDQDSVRLLTVEILISIAEVVPKEQQSSHGVLLALLRSLIEDKSWRVRYMIADRFEKVKLPRLPTSSRSQAIRADSPDRLPRLSTTRPSRGTSSPLS